MTAHVAILLRKYIDEILAGRKTIESRLTKGNKPPFDCVAPGDRIYFKASSGPYLATATAAQIECHRPVSPGDVDRLKAAYNDCVRGDDAYWQQKREIARYATFITLSDAEAIEPDEAPTLPPSRGPAWFVLSSRQTPVTFAVALTDGALRNGYVTVPRGVHTFAAQHYGDGAGTRPGRPVTLLLPDGETVQTDVKPGGSFRWRGWRSLFVDHGLTAGDRVRLSRVKPATYRVRLLRSGGTVSPDSAVTRARPPMPTSPPPDLTLSHYCSQDVINALIAAARTEDLGPTGCDVTSELLVPAALQSRATFVARVAGKLAGAALLPTIAKAYDPAVRVDALLHDGDALRPGSAIAHVEGPLRSVLAIERVALNFLTHLSGIASLTATYVDAVEGTKAGIYDTRKTIPGLRGLAKYAVACGGGRNHRIGLFDAVLIKDNHIAHLPDVELADAVRDAVTRAAGRNPRPTFVEVEVDRIDQLEAVLDTGVDLVLLDNMGPNKLRRAVALRDRIAPNVELEASGGIDLRTVRAAANTGVDRIAIGALTHSAPTLDIGLDIAS